MVLQKLWKKCMTDLQRKALMLYNNRMVNDIWWEIYLNFINNIILL